MSSAARADVRPRCSGAAASSSSLTPDGGGDSKAGHTVSNQQRPASTAPCAALPDAHRKVTGHPALAGAKSRDSSQSLHLASAPRQAPALSSAQPRRPQATTPAVQGHSRQAQPLTSLPCGGVNARTSTGGVAPSMSAQQRAHTQQPALMPRKSVTIADACTVCKSPMQNPFAAPCGHKACWSCWGPSLAKQACPVCSRRVQKRNLTKAYFL